MTVMLNRTQCNPWLASLLGNSASTLLYLVVRTCVALCTALCIGYEHSYQQYPRDVFLACNVNSHLTAKERSRKDAVDSSY